MKKGLRKLILSGTALAAVAATGATSTYAWYTTNTEVNANNIIGASAATGDASIFISGTGAAGSWKQTIDYDAGEIILSGAGVADENDPEEGGLTPVTYVAGTTNNWLNQKGQAVTTPNVINFDLYFKTAPTDDDVKIAIKSVTVENTTTGYAGTNASLPQFENILTGSSYSVNVLEALALKVGNYSSTEASNSYVGCYSLTPGGIVAAAEDYTHAAGSKISGYTAHEYVNEVMTGEKEATSAQGVTQITSAVASFPTFSATDESIAIATLPAAGTAVSVPFTVFLNGADVDCFDACKGQTFKFSIQFAIVKEA